MWKRENGQTMAEYAVTLGVITMGVAGTYGVLSGQIANVVDSVIALF